MPADVETMFSGRNIIPWHRLGTVVEGTKTSEEAIKLAGLDWEVQKHPIFARIPLDINPETGEKTGVFKRADSQFATVRMDSRAVLGVVGSRYEPFQNSEGFAVLDSLAADGVAQFETAGSLDGGAKVWMLMVAENVLRIAGDSILPYFLATTAHDGTGQIELRNCGTRVVCSNTLGQALGEKVSHSLRVRHTAGGKARLDQAAKLMGLVKDTQNAFVYEADQLLAQPYSRANFEKLVATIMPPPNPSDPNFTDRQAKSWAQRFEQVIKAYNAPDLENVRGTAWGALNAIADFEQHAARVKGDETQRLETLFKRSFLTPTLAPAAYAVLTA